MNRKSPVTFGGSLVHEAGKVVATWEVALAWSLSKCPLPLTALPACSLTNIIYSYTAARRIFKKKQTIPKSPQVNRFLSTHYWLLITPGRIRTRLGLS